MKTSQDRLREYYSDNEDKSINLIRESNNNSSAHIYFFGG